MSNSKRFADVVVSELNATDWGSLSFTARRVWAPTLRIADQASELHLLVAPESRTSRSLNRGGTNFQITTGVRLGVFAALTTENDSEIDALVDLTDAIEAHFLGRSLAEGFRVLAVDRPLLFDPALIVDSRRFSAEMTFSLLEHTTR